MINYKKITMLLFIGITLISNPLLASKDNSSEKDKEVVKVEKEEMSYKEKAKILGNKIKQGFIETSKVQGLTKCIAQGTEKYAGFTSAEDQEKAESITEKYLLMGGEEGLNLEDEKAVFDFLVAKFDQRIGQNIEKGGVWIGGRIIGIASKCVNFLGNAYYKLRLAQALEYAFKSEVKDVDELEEIVDIKELQEEQEK